MDHVFKGRPLSEDEVSLSGEWDVIYMSLPTDPPTWYWDGVLRPRTRWSLSPSDSDSERTFIPSHTAVVLTHDGTELKITARSGVYVVCEAAQ